MDIGKTLGIERETATHRRVYISYMFWLAIWSVYLSFLTMANALNDLTPAF
jgi:hypothetical protein